MYGVTFLIILMAGSGIIMKYPKFGTALNLDLIQTRYMHNQISVLFTILLIGMMLTGIFMYIYPILPKKKRPISPSTPPTGNPPPTTPQNLA